MVATQCDTCTMQKRVPNTHTYIVRYKTLLGASVCCLSVTQASYGIPVALVLFWGGPVLVWLGRALNIEVFAISLWLHGRLLRIDDDDFQSLSIKTFHTRRQVTANISWFQWYIVTYGIANIHTHTHALLHSNDLLLAGDRLDRDNCYSSHSSKILLVIDLPKDTRRFNWHREKNCDCINIDWKLVRS